MSTDTTERNATRESNPHEPNRSFESLMAEIERITLALERGDLPLDQALSSFERASSLAHEAQQLLAAANSRLTKLVQNPDRSVSETPFQLPESLAEGGRAR
jgi:exodeoxyribonuclease VII small subunit